MPNRKIITSVMALIVFALLIIPTSTAAGADYKVGDDCSEAEYGENPNGLWCLTKENGESTFQTIPVELDDSQIEKLSSSIEQIVCLNARTKAECETFGIKETKQILIKDFELTASQANDILSCNDHDVWSEDPPNSNCLQSYIEGPWGEGAPRVYYWHHYPERSAFTKFNDLDGGAKSSIIFFVLMMIFFFGLFYSGFRPEKSQRNLQTTSVALVKTLLSIVGVALVIVFIVWMYVGVIEPFFNGTEIDFSKKVLGIPQYMWPVIYVIYFTAWNLNRKK